MSSHSLPSFAQAFSGLDDHGPDRVLPPLHPYPRRDTLSRRPTEAYPSLPPLSHNLKRDTESRKRPFEHEESSQSTSPSPVKTEDVDQLDPSPSPPPARTTRSRQQLHLNTNVGNSVNRSPRPSNAAPAPVPVPASRPGTTPQLPSPSPTLSRSAHPSKRRRVTISGVANPSYHHPYGSESHHHPPSSQDFHGSHTPPPTHTGPSTPISPVVMGFTMGPQSIEQVRAMLAVKQKQKALIESRRGSMSGTGPPDGRRGSMDVTFAGHGPSGRRASVATTAPSIVGAPSVNIVNPTPTSSTGPGPSAAATPLRRAGSSPNGHRILRGSPSVSPNARAANLAGPSGSRTRSPSLLGQSAGRTYSPPLPAFKDQNRNIPIALPSAPAPPPHPTPPPSGQTRVQSQDRGPITRSPPEHQPSHHTRPPSRDAPPPLPQQQSTTTASSSSITAPSIASANQGLSALAHNLPPPPNSFARRRASQLGLRGNKPADLLISPRESEASASTQSPAPNSNSNNATTDMTAKSNNVQTRNGITTPGTASNVSSSINKSSTQQQAQVAVAIKASKSNVFNTSYSMLQPSIQSAPPRPGQQPGRFPVSIARTGLGSKDAPQISSGGGGNMGTNIGGSGMVAIPSLPPALSQSQRGTSVRRQPGQVPPTPTRLLSMQASQEAASVRLSHPTTTRMPRTATAATFAIPHGPGPSSSSSSSSLRPGGVVAGHGAGSSTLVGLGPGTPRMPATPATLHRPSDMSPLAKRAERAAFLAPFEAFYDALSDAQVLKGWFGEQLRRVGGVVKEGEKQVERLKEAVETAEKAGSASTKASGTGIQRTEVERMVREAVMLEARAWKEEVEGLRAQVADMQKLLTDGQGNGNLANGNTKGKGRGSTVTVNGTGTGRASYPTAPGTDSYTFPPTSTASTVSISAARQLRDRDRERFPPPRSASTLATHQTRLQASTPPSTTSTVTGNHASSPRPRIRQQGPSSSITNTEHKQRPTLDRLDSRSSSQSREASNSRSPASATPSGNADVDMNDNYSDNGDVRNDDVGRDQALDSDEEVQSEIVGSAASRRKPSVSALRFEPNSRKAESGDKKSQKGTELTKGERGGISAVGIDTSLGKAPGGGGGGDEGKTKSKEGEVEPSSAMDLSP